MEWRLSLCDLKEVCMSYDVPLKIPSRRGRVSVPKLLSNVVKHFDDAAKTLEQEKDNKDEEEKEAEGAEG